MTFCRRSVICVLLTAVALLFLGGCEESPTMVSVAVSFRNYTPREYPPAGHDAHPAVAVGTIDDDIYYVCLRDDDGAGTNLDLVSSPMSAAALADYLYYPDDPANQNATTPDGIHLDTVVFELTDSQVNTAVMPLRVEVYLYDNPPVTPGDPLDGERYSYYDATYSLGDRGWTTTKTISGRTIWLTNLELTVPIP